MNQRRVAVICVQHCNRLIILSALGKIAGNLKICLMKMLIQRPNLPNYLICAAAQEIFFKAGYIIEIVYLDILIDPCERLIYPSEFFENDCLETSRLDIMQVLDKTFLCQLQCLLCISPSECYQC